MQRERILAIDIGGGTQDILLYEEGKPVENCIQLILPSPTVMVHNQISELTSQKKDIFLSGYLMGGGASSKAIKKHLQEGLKVYATPQSAKTIRDNLDDVRELGVEIVSENPGVSEVKTGDICYHELKTALEAFGVEMPTRFAVAVQDHGESPEGVGNRKFRFQHWENFLKKGGHISDLLYMDPPSYFTRMWSIKEQLENVVFMDTGSAAIRGALCDQNVLDWSKEGITLINVGNQHTVGILCKGDKVLGVFEHHTRLLNKEKLQYFINKFINGSLNNEEVFNDQGHGCAITAEYNDLKKFDKVVITGPQRHLTSEKDYYWASPMGNMMLTGAYGLVAALLQKESGENSLTNMI